MTKADRMACRVAANIVEELPICEHYGRNKHGMKAARLTILAEHLRQMAADPRTEDGDDEN